MDKSRVTCVKWVPGKGDTFLVSHASGHLYTYQVGTLGSDLNGSLENEVEATPYPLMIFRPSLTAVTCLRNSNTRRGARASPCTPPRPSPGPTP